jgi:hypothetical protein
MQEHSLKRHSSSRVYLWTLPLVALICLFFNQTKANAVPVVGLTVTDRLVFFDSDVPSVVGALVSITGFQPGEHIVAVDFRPLTGQIYALGSASRLYTLNPVTGAATQVGSGSFTPSLSGIEFGLDFDPATDRLRVVSNTGQNLRLDPNTGAVVSADSALIFAPGEPQAGAQPDITGVAYTNNFKGAASSTLYAIDWRRGQLQRIGSPDGSPVSPNMGQVFTVGTLGTGFQITEMVGFDIAANSGTAYAALRSADALSGSVFCTINLSTGAATQQGQIGGGEFIRDLTVIERAVDLLAITASNKLLRFNSGNPGTIISSANITNLQSTNERIIGLDYLDDKFLYFITDASRIYSLNATTGAATHLGQFDHDPLSGIDFGVTTTPQSYIQAVSDADQNLLINPYTAIAASPRTPLAYAAGDQHSGQNPNVVGAAFTHGKPAAAVMFDIDSNLDVLVRQGAADGNPLSFESGQLFTVGPLGVNTTSMVGFDIEKAPLLCPCNNTALRTGATFASLTAPGDTVSSLYAIDLKTGAASLQGTIGGGELIRDIAVVQNIGLFGFSQLSFSGSEGDGSIPINVTRSGDTNVAASVDYETTDGGARQSQDYTYSSGTLQFAPGETSKTIQIPVIDDGLAGEGVIGEFFYLRLSNPTAGFGLDSSPDSAKFLGDAATEIRIIDNDATNSTTNPADDTDFFVRQHYRDFLNRDADAAGLAFWKNEIASCGADAGCVERKRINVSAAFFLSIEFQNTGFLVHRLYETSFNRIPSYREFMQGSQKIARGLVVGESGWEAKLEANKQAFLNEWTNCQVFREAFDAKTNAEYVDALFANAKLVPAESHRQALISDLDSHARTRAQVLRTIAEDPNLISAQFNRAFVLMQYFGYLRRNPNDPPDTDFSGYNFWLAKLNQFNGNFVNAEMVKAFIVSGEYRHRFGP